MLFCIGVATGAILVIIILWGLDNNQLENLSERLDELSNKIDQLVDTDSEY